MAKKKTESAPKAAAEKKAPAARKSAAKAGSKKAAAPAASGLDVPAINTSAAAAAAAALVANRINLAATGGQPRPESATFKALKESLHKPATGSVAGNLLGNLGGQNKSNLANAFGKQVGKNQTFGADVNRTGVPRRTGG